jgi:hypothetical protein
MDSKGIRQCGRAGEGYFYNRLQCDYRYTQLLNQAL